MPVIPATEDTPLIRVDFQNDVSWIELCRRVELETSDGLRAYVTPISHKEFQGLGSDEISSLPRVEFNDLLIFIADEVTFRSDEFPVLAIGMDGESAEFGLTVRVVAAALWDVQGNVSLANLLLSDYVDYIDSDGIYRGSDTPRIEG